MNPATSTSDDISSPPKPGSSASPSPNSARNYAVGYGAFIGSLLLVGVLAFVFKNQAEAVAISNPEPTTTVLATTSTTTSTTTTTTTTTAPPTTEGPTTVPPSTVPLADRALQEIEAVYGDIAPKSVVATPNGLFFAQNMMYRHTVTVYDQQGALLATIPDRVNLADYGVPDGVEARGSPVEAASTSDGRYVYISNYAMYGPGFGPEPGDGCLDTGWSNSYLYRVDTETLEIDQVIEVGAVPKFLAVSPDDRFVLVTNWCSFDLSIVDTESAREIGRIDIGRHPRGVAITSDSRTAYVSEMGGSDIAIIPLDRIRPTPSRGANVDAGVQSWSTDVELDWIEDVGRGPRHLVLSPDDSTLFVTLNGEGRVVKVDLESREVVEEVRTGQAPRSMAISGDGEALYVVNYNSNTMSKVLTDTMEEVQEIGTAEKPIGITVDPDNANVWVSNYTGVLQIFEDAVE